MILFFTYGIITISVNRQRFDVKKQKFICAPRLFTFWHRIPYERRKCVFVWVVWAERNKK